MTTRREFIKILTGTVIAISLPLGLFPETETPVDFTLEKIEVMPDAFNFYWIARGLAVPKNRRISPAYFTVKIKDINDWENNKTFKKNIIKDIKYSLSEHFRNRRVI